MVIEVKGRSRGEFTIYDEAVEEQARRYAEHLEAPYYIITNGVILRLFRYSCECVGNYYFQLSKTCVTIELNEMRRKLSEEGLKEALRNLSQIPGFEWITGINSRRRFVWKYMVYHKRVDVEK